MKAPFPHLQPGVRVVVNPTGQPGKWEPRLLHGRHGTFLELSGTHGYARVQFDGLEPLYNPALVHPESLVLEQEP